MAVMGMRLAQRVNGVSLLHGQVSREMFAGLWPGFDTREVPIGSVTNGVHTPTWVAPEVQALLAGGRPPDPARGGPRPRRTRLGLGPGRGRPGRGDLAHQEPAAGPAGGRDPAAAAHLVAPARRLGSRADLDRRRAGRERADHRVRPAGAVLQAAHADAERSRAAGPAAERPGPAGADHRGGQGAPGRRRRQGADPADGPVQRHPGRAAPDRVPARLRHGHGRQPGPGLRRVAEQPAAPAGGLRHLGHEGGPERRPQPLGPGRLVGRVVRRRQRLGYPVGRRRGRHQPPGRAGGPGPVRAARQVGGAAVLRPGRGRRPAGLGGADQAHAALARAQGAGRADGQAVRDRAVRACRAGLRAADRRRRVRARARAGRLEAARGGRLAGGPDRARGVRGGRAAARHGADRAGHGGAGRAEPG